MIRISWCSVNARKGAKPVSLRIKSASVNGVLEAAFDEILEVVVSWRGIVNVGGMLILAAPEIGAHNSTTALPVVR